MSEKPPPSVTELKLDWNQVDRGLGGLRYPLSGVSGWSRLTIAGATDLLPENWRAIVKAPKRLTLDFEIREVMISQREDKVAFEFNGYGASELIICWESG